MMVLTNDSHEKNHSKIKYNFFFLLQCIVMNTLLFVSNHTRPWWITQTEAFKTGQKKVTQTLFEIIGREDKWGHSVLSPSFITTVVSSWNCKRWGAMFSDILWWRSCFPYRHPRWGKETVCNMFLECAEYNNNKGEKMYSYITQIFCGFFWVSEVDLFWFIFRQQRRHLILMCQHN